MSDYAIKIENLGKKYIIGHQRQNGYKTFRDVLVEKAKGAANLLLHPFSGGAGGPGADDYEEFWALSGVNLEIKAGDRVGIIGSNGAGKSTLLKILSRITDPTSGDIWINGRVASLLEVGTGFHPELTGRENIYLNGAILGMGRVEIKRKFDEIVAFSEVEKFLDTPVKRYSSGMYVRLAFSVAAHLEPEILVVDEVLAVGDAAFQKKCLGKMEEVGKEGRTILFVSHNMGAINTLCEKSVWLDAGKIILTGPSREVAESYLGSAQSSAALSHFPRNEKKIIQYRSIAVLNADGKESSIVADDENYKLVFEIEVLQKTPEIYFGFILKNFEGVNILFADSRDASGELPVVFAPGFYNLTIDMPSVLAPGRYCICPGIASVSPVQSLDKIEAGCCFEVKNTSSARSAERPGYLNLRLPWKAAG
jgi:lipopolysaccharide transport system ATP-binding protein